MITLAVVLSGGPMGLRCAFVKFSGFVVISICHVRLHKFSSQRQTIGRSWSRSRNSRNGAMSICAKFQQTSDVVIAVHREMRAVWVGVERSFAAPDLRPLELTSGHGSQ
jgi:hypothetical protein